MDPWDDTRIQSGSEWRKAIDQALDSARVAVLLVSADFLASDFIAKVELPRLLDRAKGQGATILPVVLGACSLKHSEVGCFQAVNDPARPLAGLSKADKDKVWNQVTEAVHTALATPIIAQASTLADIPDLEAVDQSGGPWTVWVGDPRRGAPPSAAQRLQGLCRGSNPYVAGSALQAGSGSWPGVIRR